MPADNDANVIRLSLLIPLLLAEGWEAPDYRALWQAALNSSIPAIQKHGRWHVRPRDTPAIARAMRLRRRPGRPRPPSSERSVAA